MSVACQIDLFAGAVPEAPAAARTGPDGEYWLPQLTEVIGESSEAQVVLMASWTGQVWVGGYLVRLDKGLLEIMPGMTRRNVGSLYAPSCRLEALTLEVLLTSVAREANLSLGSLAPWVATSNDVVSQLSTQLAQKGLLNEGKM